MGSIKKVFTKNSVLQIDQGNLRSRLAWLKLVFCLKTPVLRNLTMDQGNLMTVIAQVHTVKEQQTCSWRTSWNCVIQHEQRVQSCNQRGRHWLQHSKRTAFYSETITWRQRSKFDSENREPPESARSSTRPTTKSIIQSLQPRIKRNDSWSWEHRLVWTTWYGTRSTVQSKSILLGRRHRPLHVRPLLAQRNGGEQEICPAHHGSPLDSELLHKRATPRAPLREEARGSRAFHREFVQEENASLGYPRPIHPRREVPQEYVWRRSQWRKVVRWTNWRTKTTRTTSLQKKLVCTDTQLVDPFKHTWFRYDAS